MIFLPPNFDSSLTEDRQFVNSLKNEIPLFEKEHFSHISNYEMEISSIQVQRVFWKLFKTKLKGKEG